MKEYGWTPQWIGANLTRMQVLLWLDQIIEWKEREAGIKRPRRTETGAIASDQEGLRRIMANPALSVGPGRTQASEADLAARDAMWAGMFDSISQPPAPTPAAEQPTNHSLDDAISAITARQNYTGRYTPAQQAAIEAEQQEAQEMIAEALRLTSA